MAHIARFIAINETIINFKHKGRKGRKNILDALEYQVRGVLQLNFCDKKVSRKKSRGKKNLLTYIEMTPISKYGYYHYLLKQQNIFNCPQVFWTGRQWTATIPYDKFLWIWPYQVYIFIYFIPYQMITFASYYQKSELIGTQ